MGGSGASGIADHLVPQGNCFLRRVVAVVRPREAEPSKRRVRRLIGKGEDFNRRNGFAPRKERFTLELMMVRDLFSHLPVGLPAELLEQAAGLFDSAGSRIGCSDPDFRPDLSCRLRPQQGERCVQTDRGTGGARGNVLPF